MKKDIVTKVRILKDGQHNDVTYRINEIWNFVKKESIHARIKLNGKETLVAIDQNPNYGIEAEIINEPEEINIQLW